MPTIRDWLGISNGDWPGPDGDGTIKDYLLSHTRLIPRDIISLGNDLSEEILRQKQVGQESLTPTVLHSVIGRSAKRFGDFQLAQCANQISSDLMPKNAALHNYSEIFTSTQAYISGVQEDVRSFVRLIGVERFPRADLKGLQEIANLHFEQATDLASVLWQNGLLGYIDEIGRRRFYSLGDVKSNFPPEVDTYVLHPCLAHTVGGSGICQRTRLKPGNRQWRRIRILSMATGLSETLLHRTVRQDRVPSRPLSLPRGGQRRLEPVILVRPAFLIARS